MLFALQPTFIILAIIIIIIIIIIINIITIIIINFASVQSSTYLDDHGCRRGC